MKIIKLMDYFLKKEEDLDLYVTTYNILPISHDYGYIEFVPNSTTLYSLREENKFSIQSSTCSWSVGCLGCSQSFLQ